MHVDIEINLFRYHSKFFMHFSSWTSGAVGLISAPAYVPTFKYFLFQDDFSNWFAFITIANSCNVVPKTLRE